MTKHKPDCAHWRIKAGSLPCTCGADKPRAETTTEKIQRVGRDALRGHIGADKPTPEYSELFALFEEAVDHLEYCGYGDSYERECAMDANLPYRLREGLKELKEVLHE